MPPIGLLWLQQIRDGKLTLEQISERFPDVDVATVLAIIHRRYPQAANQRR